MKKYRPTGKPRWQGNLEENIHTTGINNWQEKFKNSEEWKCVLTAQRRMKQ